MFHDRHVFFFIHHKLVKEDADDDFIALTLKKVTPNVFYALSRSNAKSLGAALLLVGW